MATIKEIEGDIFNTTAQTLVNTVNCDGVMGKGIALEFKNRYPEMFESYVVQCKHHYIKPGILYLHRKTKPWILNFPTKLHWRSPSKLEYIRLGLEKFSKEYKLKGIKSIAFPKLGTMNGGLSWEEVKELMYKYLKPLPNLSVEIYHYNPNSNDNIYMKFIKLAENYQVIDIKKNIGLTNKQSEILFNIIHNGITNFIELENINGIGKKSIEKIKYFTTHSATKEMNISHNQLDLPFK